MSAESAIDVVVDRLAELLGRRIGLRAEPTITDRLRRVVRAETGGRHASADAYLEFVRGDTTAAQELLDRITVQETAFFRHPEHFEILARDILPTLRPPVTLWSAACSTGQEPFSLAMVLVEQRVPGLVLATDISTTALRRTAGGRYAPRELAGLSEERIARHTTRIGPLREMKPAVRDQILVSRHNLVDAIPDRVRGCQVVFCRNVLIYFSAEQAGDFLDRLADALAPGAVLFLGAAETIWQFTDRFEAVPIGQSFVHRVRRAAAPPAERPRRAGSQQAGEVRPAAEVTAEPDAADPAEQAMLAMLAARTGQQAAAAGDNAAATVAFRRWAYLAPDDALAHLHLALALEAAGDHPSARRAFGAARRALHTTDPAAIEHAMEGYTPDELTRFLDAKQEGRAQ